MNKTISIKLKATFLLIIFSLNIVTGFACSIGIDMGYNKDHHEHEENKDSMHHHGQKDVYQQEKKDKDDCCKDSVTKISLQDKEVAHKTLLNVPGSYVVIDLPATNELAIRFPSIINYPKYYNQGHHPPIPDIRIAIQSFLI